MASSLQRLARQEPNQQCLTGRNLATVANYRYAANHAVSRLGAVKLRDLTARQVQAALAELSRSLSSRSLRLVHQVIERAIRQAEAADLVAQRRVLGQCA
jgi:hypothetical protein